MAAGQNRLRAKESRIRITKDGVPLAGEWLTVTGWSLTPDSEITKTELTGEKRSRLDHNIRGYDFTVDFQVYDGSIMAEQADIDRRERSGLPNPQYQVTLLLNFRELGVPSQKVTIDDEVTLKFGELAASGHDYVTMRVEGSGRGMAAT